MHSKPTKVPYRCVTVDIFSIVFLQQCLISWVISTGHTVFTVTFQLSLGHTETLKVILIMLILMTMNDFDQAYVYQTVLAISIIMHV